MLQENIDAEHQWRRQSVVYEIQHITEGYTELSNRLYMSDLKNSSVNNFFFL